MQPAPAGRRVFSDVDDRAAEFAADRQTLEDSQPDQQERRSDADRGVARQQPDQESRDAHQREGREEGDLAAHEVAEPPEQDRAQRPHDEADREGRERQQEGGRFVDAREEMRGERARERAVEEEVVPLEQRAERRGTDHVRAARAPRRAHACLGTARHRCAQALRRKTGSLRPIR